MIAISILFLIASMGTSGGQVDRLSVETTVSVPPNLLSILTRYEGAWRAKDATALSQLFAEDGYVLPSGGTMVHGRQAIQELYRGQGGPLFLRAVAFATEGDVGYIIGTFRHEQNGPDSGKFTLTLTKRSGEWLIMSDMDNGDRR